MHADGASFIGTFARLGYRGLYGGIAYSLLPHKIAERLRARDAGTWHDTRETAYKAPQA